MKTKKYYVYQLKTSENEILYVGKGTGNRMYKHSYVATTNNKNRDKNLELYDRIKDILDSGGYIISEIIFESNNEAECLTEEIKIIEEIGLDNLYNKIGGGQGTSGYKWSDESRLKLSKSKMGHHSKLKGTTLSSDHKKKLKENSSRFWKGKKLPDETKLKMSEAKRGIPKSESHKKKLSESIKLYWKNKKK